MILSIIFWMIDFSEQKWILDEEERWRKVFQEDDETEVETEIEEEKR